MGCEWPIVALSSCASFQEGYVNPTQLKPEYFDGPIKWLRATDLNDGFVFNTTRSLSLLGFKSAGKSALLFEPDTLAISKSGTIGRVGILKDFMCGNRAVINIKPNKAEVDTRFIFYVLKLNRRHIETLATGSVQPNLYTSALGTVEFKKPPLQDQQKIGYFLGGLDNKIELNRQLNQTLEQMAQALFKSWFVDFDPVIDNALAAGNEIPSDLQDRAERRQLQLAKADHKPLPENIRKLFPSEFELTESLGWVPKGWSGTLENLLVLQRGFDLPKDRRTDGAYPLIAASGQDGTHDEYKVIGPGVVTGRSGKLGEVCFVYDDFWPLNTTLWIKEYKNSSPYHAFYVLKNLDLQQYNSGSAVPTLNRNHVSNLPQVVPSKEIIAEYDSICAKLKNRQKNNLKQDAELSQLRDTLLPKLISGELRIPEAKAQLEEALV